jgi:AraC-like DNA-binding protein
MNLLEKRTSFGGLNAELSIFETSIAASNVTFCSSHLHCGILLTGKKIISIGNSDPFEFVPGDIIVVAPNQISRIDFPEADKNVVRCIVVEVSNDKVSKVLDRLHPDLHPYNESNPWAWNASGFTLLPTDGTLKQFFRRLVEIFKEKVPFKDVLIDNTITELIIRLLQTKSKHHIVDLCKQQALSYGIQSVLHHIKNNIRDKMVMEDLAAVAGMSKANFYRHFKNELGISPHQFVQKERIDQACTLLKDRGNSITDVCSSAGFSTLSHFIHTFKEQKGMTPKYYQKLAIGKNNAPPVRTGLNG